MMKPELCRQISNEGLHQAADVGDIENLKTILETGEINVDCQLEAGKVIWRRQSSKNQLRHGDRYSGINKDDYYLIPSSRFKKRSSIRHTNSPKVTWIGRSLLHKVPEENCNEVEVTDGYEENAISVAAKSGMSLTLQTLLESGGDPNIEALDNEGFTSLMRCACHGHAECMQLLLDYGANLCARTVHGSSAIHLAAANNNACCLKKLLDAGANVDMETKYGATPLIMAAKEGNTECVALLLENHANVNVTYRKHQTALLFAAEEGYEDCINLLLDAGADIHKCNNQGVTPLMRAVQHNHDHCALVLLEHGARVNDIDMKCRTALHYACESNNSRATQYLLKYGVDIHAKTKGGSTALKYAQRAGHIACAKTLEKHIYHETSTDNIKIQKQNRTTPSCFGKLFPCSSPFNSD